MRRPVDRCNSTYNKSTRSVKSPLCNRSLLLRTITPALDIAQISWSAEKQVSDSKPALKYVWCILYSLQAKKAFAFSSLMYAITVDRYVLARDKHTAQFDKPTGAHKGKRWVADLVKDVFDIVSTVTSLFSLIRPNSLSTGSMFSQEDAFNLR